MFKRSVVHHGRDAVCNRASEQSCQSGVSGNLFHKWVPPVLNFVCLVKECKIGRVYITVTDLVKEHQI